VPRILTPGLTFDEALHRYALDGLPVPGVTSILDAAGFVSEWQTWSEEARDRGSAAHAATQYDDEGDLAEGSIDPLVVPYLEAWRRFRRETRFAPIYLKDGGLCREVAVASSLYRFATTVDAVGLLPGFGAPLTVVEIKTGLPGEAAALQTAAHQLALEENGIRTLSRCAVQLSRDGRYRIHRYEDRANDRDDFIAALRVARRLGRLEV
jgi:hypothetical protein